MAENGPPLQDSAADTPLSARTIGSDFERRFDKRNPGYLVGPGAADSRTLLPLPNIGISPERHLTPCEFPVHLNRT